ncbi:hypothetical protein [Klebsiella pasteurii]|uniref:hypothetical protein n=1 Tax=Klebsiella pasteurii TaxID=2587529 RepID=UPI00287E13AD|nr:hypothetical protein [Klebsiella pasteurii]MDS7876762.1 hypothetical protein [Klebsiella pasteurii]
MALKEERPVASCSTVFCAGSETIAPENLLTPGRKNNAFMLYSADLTRNKQNKIMSFPIGKKRPKKTAM